jgi:hypothetical protein
MLSEVSSAAWAGRTIGSAAGAAGSASGQSSS